MMKMLTLFGKDIKELRFNELKRERRCQQFMVTQLKVFAKKAEVKVESNSSYIREDRLAFINLYIAHLEALIGEIDYYLDRRAEPAYDKNKKRSRETIREDNKKRRARVIADNRRVYEWTQSVEQDGLLVSWDRERFLLIAEDRGYFTEEIITTAVAKEINLDVTRARAILQNGRFTWGQVLCLGAFLQMTPKEFCDVFLAGYFVNSYGEYRADYTNLCKGELLKRAIKPQVVADD